MNKIISSQINSMTTENYILYLDEEIKDIGYISCPFCGLSYRIKTWKNEMHNQCVCDAIWYQNMENEIDTGSCPIELIGFMIAHIILMNLLKRSLNSNIVVKKVTIDELEKENDL
ncbi:MAG: hypothetical protein R6V50_02220 [Thermoplasmatota archaeon]